MTRLCISKLTVTGPYNGLSPGRRQTMIWTIAGIFLIGPLGTKFCLGLNVLNLIHAGKMGRWQPVEIYPYIVRMVWCLYRGFRIIV